MASRSTVHTVPYFSFRSIYVCMFLAGLPFYSSPRTLGVVDATHCYQDSWQTYLTTLQSSKIVDQLRWRIQVQPRVTSLATLRRRHLHHDLLQ